MKVLVAGGAGVIGRGVIPELLGRGHVVRLLSRNADEDAGQWEGVEAFRGDVADAASIAGAAAGCAAVLHIAGIAGDPHGTQNVLAEAERARVRRLVFVSSSAEPLVEHSALDWTIVRPEIVYGPGDDVISKMLEMVRALPAVPVIGDGDREFQPIWYEDLGHVLAAVLERPDCTREIVDAAGPEITTMNDLLRRFGEITGRKPLRVPVPMALAELTMTVLPEHNGKTAFARFDVEATPLDHGLRVLADALPEVTPDEGVGSLEHKRFFADIRGSRYSAPALMMLFRERVNDFMPLEFAAEPGAPEKIEKGVTLTGHLPLRGHFQVRVEVAEPMRVVFATIEGHPLAGIVEFTTSETSDGVRFAIDNYARGSNLFDLIAVRTLGGPAQSANWRDVVERVIAASGGTSDGVHEEKEFLRGDDASRLEKRVKEMVQARSREATAAHPASGHPLPASRGEGN
jgi:uncharacterized protein YbjT (DUF2867 family)